MAEAITGSWFPTGYHGHARSKSRNDIFQEYRLQAKPHPPEKLLKRLRNKGKYRTKSALGGSSEFKKDLISWIPTQSEGQREWPIISTYQADFWHHRNPQSTAVMIPQLLVPRVRQLITVTHPGVETMQTTYRQFYSHCQPNPNIHTNIYTGKVQRMPMEKEATFVYVNPRPKLANGRSGPGSSLSECFTVADCLSWSVPQKRGTSD
ncbi:ciliary microtubule inner protein 7-like isoform X2 [Hemitrygon akajei]|uniref:ciliary microtubule inner protein 7-like isoform X2 n=1 Tax=Hemitrygon akajei TaxID=2704970 RepID=UPI003BF9B931